MQQQSEYRAELQIYDATHKDDAKKGVAKKQSVGDNEDTAQSKGKKKTKNFKKAKDPNAPKRGLSA